MLVASARHKAWRLDISAAEQLFIMTRKPLEKEIPESVTTIWNVLESQRYLPSIGKVPLKHLPKTQQR